MLSEAVIKRLEAMGFTRWKWMQYDRLYIAPKLIGLEITQTSKGELAVIWCGDGAIGKWGRLLRDNIREGKYFIDVDTEEIHMTYETPMIAEMLKRAKAEAKEEEKKARWRIVVID